MTDAEREAMRRLIRNQFRVGRALYALALNPTLARVAGSEWVQELESLASETYKDGNRAAVLICGHPDTETWLSGDDNAVLRQKVL